MSYRYGSASKQFIHTSDAPMSENEIALYAPSVMAAEPHESRGERYAYISTIEILRGLQREGFGVHEVRQTKVRNEGKRDFTKHLVRLRHADSKRGAEVPEIILLNSHDGTSSYQILDGIFRFICSNGLICGDIGNVVKVRHSGRVMNDVIEGSFRVLDAAKGAVERIDAYKGISLSHEEQRAFAAAALQLRWEDTAPIEPGHAIQARRFEDRKPDLWTTFNRVQENLVRGGQPGLTATGKNTRTREVTSVGENVKLNRALFTLADTMARIKNGEPVAA